MNGVRQDRNQHSHKSVIWLGLAALCAAALGPAPSAAQTDEPPDPPNLRVTRGQLADSPFEVPVEDTLVLETYNIRSALPPVVPYIIGGGPAEPDTFSWQVDLGDCGGTLIARDWVLTAAHCLGEGMPASVRVGSYELGGGQEIEVSAIHIHPEFPDSIFDIALLHLATAAPEALGVVALPDLATHNRLAVPGRTATAIGWGAIGLGPTESDSRPTHLQQAELLLEGCVQDYSYNVCTTTLLFTDFATNACFGDSGGPLLARDGGTYYQIGITSRGPELVTRAPICYDGTIFEKVASHLDWISSVTGIAFVEPPPAPEDPMAVDICSRTPAVREEILSITGVADCAAVTDADLAAITRLDLSNAGLTALQEGDFAGLSSLAFLDMGDNGLTQLPQILFADLAALAELVLHRNRLRTLPADVFDPLAALTLLDLAENSLIELSEETFDNLSGLITLNISRNGIAALPEGVFDELGSLTELNLERNPLAALPGGIFAELTELKTLSLGDQFRSLTLTAGVFDGLEGLLWLRLRGVASLSADAFAGTRDLLELDISNGAFSSLPAGVFDNLSSLLELNLEGNPIAEVPEGIFAGLTELKILFLGDSTGSLTVTAGMFDGLEGLRWLKLLGIASLPDDVFAGTPNLHTLDVSDGALSSLPAGMFDNLNGLIELNLEGNPIAAVPEDIFANLTELEILSLGDSTGSLTVTAGMFDGLEGLRWLKLLGIASLPDDAFAGTPNLRHLEVVASALSSLPAGVFDNLSSLTELNLRGNPIAAVPEDIFANLTELEILSLGDSRDLLSLPFGGLEGLVPEAADDVETLVPLTLTAGVFDGLEGLKVLTLHSLASLPADLFAGTPNLVILTVTEGTFSSLPTGVFDSLSSLQALAIDRCGITALPPGIFDNMSSLNGLNLSGNPLTAVPEGIFANLTELEILSLGDSRDLLSLLFGGLEGLVPEAADDVETLVPLTLTAGVFDGLEGLKVLTLHSLASLPADLFAGTPNLEFLTVSDGALSSIPSGVFDRLTNLGLLNLQNNGLATLPAGVFEGLSNLEILGLADNEFATLPAGVFNGLTNLVSLNLGGNEMTTLPAGLFAGLSNLQFLHLLENPGIPFILTPKLQPVGSGQQDGTVKLRIFVAEGAPFKTSVSWTATGEVIGAAMGRVSVPAGSLYSEPFKVTGADSRGEISIALSDPNFLGVSDYFGQALALATGDPLTLDLAALPSSREQFVVDEDIPEMPTGVWSPDLLSRASFSQVGGQTAITFSHGGRIEEDGVSYTCMSGGGCEIKGTMVAKGVIFVSKPAAQAELLVAGVGQFVDERTVFQEKIYNGYELGDSTATLRSVAGEITRVSFLDPGGDLVFADFSSDDPATEMVITLEGFSGVLEESPYDQEKTRYARGLATVTMVNPTDLTWLEVISLGNHIDRVDLALIVEDTFAGPVDGMADLQAVVIEGEGSIGAIDAANANFVSPFGTIGIDAGGAIVKRALSIGDITPREGVTPVLRISAESLDRAEAGEGETVIIAILIAGGDLREATGDLQIDTGGVVYPFRILAAAGERSIGESAQRTDLGDGILDAVTDTFVASPDDYFEPDGQKSGVSIQ